MQSVLVMAVVMVEFTEPHQNMSLVEEQAQAKANRALGSESAGLKKAWRWRRERTKAAQRATCWADPAGMALIGEIKAFRGSGDAAVDTAP
ncbi:hypothetical protein SRHO_G00037960 [Serrasalmus rhombeus]